MRIDKVIVDAFGPLQGESLDLASGMTIVHGPNESGKSSWHAALFGGLCGQRRGKGARRRAEERFSEQHRPWEEERWAVRLLLTLDDGRRVELVQDLNNRARSRAVDLVLGEDLTGEIIFEGAPDGARWLGLERRSFVATACVRQADLLGVLSDPSQLQEQMQRAAATAGADETAAAAIAALETFHKERVGSDRARTRPLSVARKRLLDATARLEGLRRTQADYAALARRAEEAERRCQEATSRYQLLRAAAARMAARSENARLVEIVAIRERCPQGPPPAREESDPLEQAVREAVARWKSCPDEAECRAAGPSPNEVAERIQALPEVPTGDLIVHDSVERAGQELSVAEQRLDLHRRTQPPSTGGVLLSVTVGELMQLAADLERHEPVIDPAVEGRADRLRATVAKPHWGPFVWIGASSFALAAGTFLFASLSKGAGLALLGVGAVIAIGGWLSARRASRRRRDLRALERRLGPALTARGEVVRRREAARHQVESLGLPVDPSALRDLADRAARAERQRDEELRWSAQLEVLERELLQAERRLGEALQARGASRGDSSRLDLETYSHACARRQEIAREAAKRPHLLAELQAREAVAEAVARSRRARADALEALRAAADRCELPPGPAPHLAAGLEGWLESRAREQAAQERARSEWTRAEALLGGRSIEEVRLHARRLEDEADALALGLDRDELEAFQTSADLRTEMESARVLLVERQRAADTLLGQLQDRARQLDGGPEAEEELDAARRDLARLETLDDTLGKTLAFLEQAQRRVHRDLAPALAQSVSRWLPRVTGGRYAEVVVHPATLEVQVRDEEGDFRPALRLSHGTAEQVYLLLRIALAEHLTRGADRCPLLFDDITAHFDTERTEAVLDVLHEISRERQVILMSKEEDVLVWAKRRLEPLYDRLTVLPPRRRERRETVRASA